MWRQIIIVSAKIWIIGNGKITGKFEKNEIANIRKIGIMENLENTKDGNKN